MHHLHYPASVSINFFKQKLQEDERIFVNKKFELKIILTNKDFHEGFTRVKTYIQKKGWESLIHGLMKNTTFNKNFFNLRDTEEIFMSFGNIFENIFVYEFEPLYKEGLINTVETLMKDNLSSCELRMVLGLYKNSENKKGSLQEEMDFLQKTKEEIKKKYNFNLAFIWTGIKLEGKEKILQNFRDY